MGVDPIPDVVDLIVRTTNPDLLDATVQQLGAAAVVAESFDGDTCRVRVFGDPGFIKYAITNQGYGELVGQVPVGRYETEGDRRRGRRWELTVSTAMSPPSVATLAGTSRWWWFGPKTGCYPSCW